AGERGGCTVPDTKAPTKRQAVKRVAAVAKKDPEPTSGLIHKLDGKFQEERSARTCASLIPEAARADSGSAAQSTDRAEIALSST
ncbi:MAG TPA: DUF2188 domain-containing protein, partial [Solirubrobacterales bacterium]|nr:DUF2188 domain-containing protein [Solirubrobacterales bacterium]